MNIFRYSDNYNYLNVLGRLNTRYTRLEGTTECIYSTRCTVSDHTNLIARCRADVHSIHAFQFIIGRDEFMRI